MCVILDIMELYVMKRILKSSIIIICVLFAVGLTGCSCSNQERTYYSGNTNSIDKDFLKNTGLIIGEDIDIFDSLHTSL